VETEDRDILTQRHKISPRRASFGFGSCIRRDRAQTLVLDTESLEFQLEIHHPADSLKVHALGRKLADAMQARYIAIAVAPVATLGACWLYEAATLVDTKCLRVHASQLGGNGDDINGVVS